MRLTLVKESELKNRVNSARKALSRAEMQFNDTMAEVKNGIFPPLPEVVAATVKMLYRKRSDVR